MNSKNKEFRFGDGKISAYLSVSLGLLSLAAVVCFHFPEYLTTPHLRAIYPIDFFRTLLTLTLFISFVFGIVSFVLSQKKGLAIVGMGLALTGTVLGGGQVVTPDSVETRIYLGLDWFVLDILVIALVFIPIERLFFRVEQKIFRPFWQTDFYHFFVSHLMVQATSFLILLPSLYLGSKISFIPLQLWVKNQPIWLQFIEVMLIADLFQYGVHRLFHQVPFLWRFHSIHHSAEQMDWLAGSRLHLLDIVVTRGLTLIPLFLLGFHQSALQIYLVFVAFWATFLHANIKWQLHPFKNVFVMPIYHHWHHAAEKEAIDKNFAIHFPFLDRIFGSYYLPAHQWPTKYGLEGQSVPQDYLGQTFMPFVKNLKGGS
jgi:sterol desaturase/sphingolipid hydroxylase (fatty acid hydroxylase superfamily)